MAKTIDLLTMPLRKKVRYSTDPKYRGVYAYKAKTGVITWYLLIKVDGKNQWVRIGAHTDGITQDHVVAKRQEVQAAQFMGNEMPIQKPKPTITLNEAWDNWVAWKTSEGYSESYLKTEKNRWDNHVRDSLGHMQLSKLAREPHRINSLQGELRKKKLSQNTIKQVLMNVKKAFKQAQGEGSYTGPIPFRQKNDPSNQGVLIRNSRARRERWLTREQAREFMDYLWEQAQHSHPLYAQGGLKAYRQCAFALYTGLRLGEVLKLTLNDIDLTTMQIHVRNVKNAGATDKSRYVDIPQVLVPIINGIIVEKEWKPRERFWTSYAKRTVEKAIDHFQFNKGIPGRDFQNRISFHSLRHTFGALHVEQGTHLVTIKEMMGHDTIEAVQIYAKAGPNVRKAAMNRFNELW